MKRKSFIKRRGTTSRSKAVALADKWFSIYTRLKDTNQHGQGRCTTCGRKMGWRDGDCGHFQTRGNLNTRWVIMNAHLQCGRCNMLDGEQFKHGIYIDARYGMGTTLMLQSEARKVSKFTTMEILDIAEKFELLARAEAEKRGIDLDRQTKSWGEMAALKAEDGPDDNDS